MVQLLLLVLQVHDELTLSRRQRSADSREFPLIANRRVVARGTQQRRIAATLARRRRQRRRRTARLVQQQLTLFGEWFLSECRQLGRVRSLDRVGGGVYKVIRLVMLRGLLGLMILAVVAIDGVRNSLDRHQHVGQQVVQLAVAIICERERGRRSDDQFWALLREGEC